MSMIFLAAMMMGQATAAAPQPAPVQQQAPQKAKPAQVCEYLEVTGSRSKRRVCHDAGTAADLNAYGVSNSAFGKTKVDAPPASVGGPGGFH